MRALSIAVFTAFAALSAGAAFAQQESAWSIEAVEGSCRVSHLAPDDAPAGAAAIHGFRWDPQQQVLWTVMAGAEEGTKEGDPLQLKVLSASGPSFSGSAEHFVGEGMQGYYLTTPDRKDVSVVLAGDVTFTYEGLNGRAVSYVLPLGRQLPRIRQCMSQARAQTKAIAEAGGPTRRASGSAERAPPRRSGEPELVSYGSGVFVNNQGQLLTNAHVVEGCAVIGNETIGQGKLLAVDEGSDLALLQFEGRPKAFASLRSGGLRLGESVIAAGFPISDLLNNGLNVTTGNISALSGIQGDRRFVQITTPVQPGNSGGPLLDASGRVVGIVSRGLKNEVLGEGKTVQNINYAVAPYVVRAFLEEHRVPFTQARDSRETAESIAAKAQSHTVRLECYA